MKQTNLHTKNRKRQRNKSIPKIIQNQSTTTKKRKKEEIKGKKKIINQKDSTKYSMNRKSKKLSTIIHKQPVHIYYYYVTII